MRTKLLSGEHFTVDGTLIEAWASLKSFQRKGADASKRLDDDPGNPTVNFHGERRSNETHQSTTDPEALLARKGKGKEAKLYYSANALAENRNFLLVDFQVEPADGKAERRAAEAMADERLAGRITLTHGSLSSSLRVFMLDYFRNSSTEDGHMTAGHGRNMFMSQ